MKYSTLTFICLFSATSMLAQGANKSLVKSFNLEGNTTVQLDVAPQQVAQVKEWSSDFMRVQIDINLENFNANILKSLIQAGRYNLKGHTQNNNYIVQAPNITKAVKIRGTELIDKVSYTIFVPVGTIVELSNGNQAVLEN